MAQGIVRAFWCIFVLIFAAAMPVALGDFNWFACPINGFANFGDSLTDTGNLPDAFPFFTDVENPPYGETFFGAPSKRFCNGRLVPDYFSLAFNARLLDPYFGIDFNYRTGINFASSGATASVLATLTPLLSPFALPFQVGQFIRFKNSVVQDQSQLACTVNFFNDLPPSTSVLSTWLYTIEIGGNDILSAATNGTSFPTIINSVIPAAVANIKSAIQTLYAQSARRFLIFSIPAQGCSAIAITLFSQFNLPKDSMGCIIAQNSLATAYNTQLNQTIQGLRTTLPGSTISYFDYYGANLEILRNNATYGFTNTLSACCGAPGVGTLNYNPAVTCGRPGSNNCPNPNQFVNWDGVHFTDAFYREIAKFALAGRFTDVPVNYTFLCNLDFNDFGPNRTYAQAYPAFSTCQNLSL